MLNAKPFPTAVTVFWRAGRSISMLNAKLVTIAGLNATEVQIKPLWLKLRDATRSLSRRNCLNL